MFKTAVMAALALGIGERLAAQQPQPQPTRCVVSLDGDDWLLAVDPDNVGRDQQWYATPRPDARETKVPWIIQDAFPGYHGVAWYWRTFEAPAMSHDGGRYLLRFWAVDYTAGVWVNGQPIGQHEGGEAPFTLDATDAMRPGEKNLLAVRVLNPTHQPIDGIVLRQTPHRNKTMPYHSGATWNQGGVMDSVELIAAPAVRVDDLFVRPEWDTGRAPIETTVFNAGGEPVGGTLELTLAPAAGGATVAATVVPVQLPPGASTVGATLHVDRPRLWQLNDPFLYRVTARVRVDDRDGVDECSVRCGFRDFRFADGYFRLNGRRIYLRCSHTGNCCPIGLELPHDPDLLRRDLIHVKMMGFNAIRFIAGVAKRYQLDLCDEIGLLVYEESYAAWLLEDSPAMPRRFDESVLGMVRRDRNHPSVVIWGLLNETSEGPVFRQAVGLLPRLRAIDDSRMVMLNSGRWDTHSGGVVGIQMWQDTERVDPCVTFNPTKHVIRGLGITWAPGQLAFHPGRNGEYGVVRWTAPAAGSYDVVAKFHSIAKAATTDVCVLHNGRSLFAAPINLDDSPPRAEFTGTIEVAQGDRVDLAVGFGNGNYGADTTAVAATFHSSDGRAFDAAADFSHRQNPNGSWSYGQMQPGEKPDAATFRLFGQSSAVERVGSLSNPRSTEWEDVLSDQHPYQRVPHTADVIHTLRTIDGAGLPLFISEYGVGSAIDLPRVVRSYEQLGKASADDAVFYRRQYARFIKDWRRWQLDDTFDRPEDYFRACLAKMASQRTVGINAIRANPHCVGYSLTGTVDQGMTGEGLTTTFRQFKPGTVEALHDALAPLRWCLFVEPVHIYRGGWVRLRAVLANEDVLLPGEYPVRIEVVGPDGSHMIQYRLTVTIEQPTAGEEPSWVIPVLSSARPVDGPSGEYRLLATFEQGASAAGGAVRFFVTDAAEMPPVEGVVTLCDDDPRLAEWLAQHGIEHEAFAPDATTGGQAVLVGRQVSAPVDATFAALARQAAAGSTIVFLDPGVFRRGDDPLGWLPLAEKGTLATMRSWVYLKDEWAKRHPIFDGLPSGGLMDLTYYREMIPDVVFAGQSPPAEAVCGGINTSQAYSSGLMLAVHSAGEGRIVITTLPIADQLGSHPAAERLLRNLLRYAGESHRASQKGG